MQIISDRRALHRIPELDRDLPQTLAYLRAALSPLGCTLFSPCEGSLCAFFDFGRDAAIAFRADMDALPIREMTGAAYASQHEGKMHACGHDGHMAILLELARRLREKKTLPHNALLVFQCAEETTGGAKPICETGVFQKYNVQAIFGLHLWPGLAAGTVASRSGALMCRSCEVTVTVTGKSAHIAKAREGRDALEAGVAYYSMVTTREKALPPDVFRVLNFGRMESGTVRNAISGKTTLYGTLRAYDDGVFEHLRADLLEVAALLREDTGCAIDVHMSEGYPAVINPAELYARVKAVAPFAQIAAPSLTAEDFSWYQRFVPGMFFFLGTGDTPALHADNFDFDEQILLKGADFFENLAENFL